MQDQSAIDDIEYGLFLEAVFRRYGYDFRNYSRKSLRRRVQSILDQEHISDIGQLTWHCLRDQDLFLRILPTLTVSTSSMFRDPESFLSLRQNVIPLLHTYPHINIWHAGCSTGEEVYSLAIVLKEENLYDKATIFATDINPTALKLAKEGIYTVDKVKEYTQAYQQAGGRECFSDYYTAHYGHARMDRSLIENVTFVEHNLATDAAFTEAHLILCRNVFIYFNQSLQEKTARLFLNSLVYKGILCLGSAETVRLLSCSHLFDDYDEKNRIFQKNAEFQAPIFRA
ncbi:MAG: CheR family methyltransferase [Oligoflexus sp.]